MSNLNVRSQADDLVSNERSELQYACKMLGEALTYDAIQMQSNIVTNAAYRLCRAIALREQLEKELPPLEAKP